MTMFATSGVISGPVSADPWQDVRAMTDRGCLTVGPQLSYAIKERPDRLVFMYARYWVASKLIGSAENVVEIGCSEGSGAGMLAVGRRQYVGVDTDAKAIQTAWSVYGGQTQAFPQIAFVHNATGAIELDARFDAAVSLDVAEHVPREREDEFIGGIVRGLTPYGMCVIGTPNALAAQWASAESNAGHINLYEPSRLRALLEKHFRVVQMMYMNDTSVHFGLPQMAHYIIGVGIAPR